MSNASSRVSHWARPASPLYGCHGCILAILDAILINLVGAALRRSQRQQAGTSGGMKA
jgi:hypothetical protein